MQFRSVWKFDVVIRQIRDFGGTSNLSAYAYPPYSAFYNIKKSKNNGKIPKLKDLVAQVEVDLAQEIRTEVTEKKNSAK
jgi:hypothetical protein